MQALLRLGALLRAVRVQRGDRLARLHAVALVFVQHDARAEVDRAFLRLATGAEQNARAADLLGVRAHDAAALRRPDSPLHGAQAEPRRIAQVRAVAALRLDHLAQLLERRAAFDGVLRHRPRRLDRSGLFAEIDHIRRKLEAHRGQVRRPLPAERFADLDDLERIADGAAERAVHVGDERDGPAADLPADFHHLARERFGVRLRFHERAAAGFDVEQDAVAARRDLLAHDRRGDQRDALDRAGHVAQRVELFVGRAEVAGLPDDGAAHAVHDGEEFLPPDRGAHAGNALHLVDGAARVPEPAAAHLRDLHAARRRDRHDHEARLVADAARRVFVDRHAVHAGEVDRVAGVRHRARQPRRLARRHALKADRHHQRRKLVVRDAAVRAAAHDRVDFRVAQRAAVPLFADDIHHMHKTAPFSVQVVGREALGQKLRERV